MNFVTYRDLNEDIIRNLHRIPNDIDVVVGVPRSGLLVASQIALYRNLPVVLTDKPVFLHRRPTLVR
jgi:adenine/guanine phosphoribosyltransferase-like PRPP-binding protein